MQGVHPARERARAAGGRGGARRRAAAWLREKRALELELAALRNDKQEIERSLFEAAQVQRRLCGARQWRRSPFDLAAEIFPVRHLSGDFLSVVERDGELRIALGDIAGKGIAAGMWFTQMVGLVQSELAGRRDPAAALEAINAGLQASTARAPLTTLFLGCLELETGILRYSSAGHPPALLLKPDGAACWLTEGGLPLNAIGGARYQAGEARMAAGDTVLAFSDGLLERTDSSTEEFGARRLALAAQRVQGRSAQETLFGVLGAVEDFAARQAREDDFALLVLRRDERGAAERARQ